ncbi:MAG: alpha/beta hydrolase [Chloroflexota bacterium]
MKPAALDQLLWRSSKPTPVHPQTKIIDVDTTQVRIRDTAANKPAIIFFCDPPIMVELYDELIEQIGPEFRVVVLELPGFGFSKLKSASALKFSETILAVEAAIQQLELGPVVLCGPCICGFVVTALAHRANLDVAGLVLMQTPDLAGMFAWTERMDPKRQLRTPYLGQILVRVGAKRLTQSWLRYATGKTTDHSVMSQKSTEVLEAGGSYPLATMLQLWSDGPRDHAIELPALIFWGQQDRSHVPTERTSTLKHVPQGELIKFEHCGHFPELEDPVEFSNRARPFFQSCLYSAKEHNSM